MRVEWHEYALDQLADLYVDAAGPAAKAAVGEAAERVTARVAEEGLFLGESRGNDYQRVWFHYPLAVMYNIEPGIGGGAVVHHVTGLRPCHDQDAE